MARYKELDKLTDNMRPKVEDFLKETEKYGVRLSETWRSDEQQMEDYNNGYSQLNGIPPNVSQHQLGKAVDIFFDPAVTGVDGIYNVPFSTWQEVGRIGKKNGLDWGYAMWKWDKPHFQDDGTIYQSNPDDMTTIKENLHNTILLQQDIWAIGDKTEGIDGDKLKDLASVSADKLRDVQIAIGLEVTK